MRKESQKLYRCPRDGSDLLLRNEVVNGGEITSGDLYSPDGSAYRIVDGIPNLIFPEIESTTDKDTADFYDERVDAYDENLHLTFKTHGQDEDVVRNEFIDLLHLKDDSVVLEVAAGTGRDSVLIADRLSRKGALHISDISPGMLSRCREKLLHADYEVPIDFHLSNAINLPYESNSFDALYCFGALSEVSDVRQCLGEMVRVCKVGARVVLGATCVAPWLREADYGRILIETNPFFKNNLPLEELPVDVRDVHIRWGIGYAYYLIDFSVGEGEPFADFDFQIPGVRGGTYRTRFEGKLEGVTKIAKDMAYQARAHRGVSMHEWLDEAVREKAERDLSK